MQRSYNKLYENGKSSNSIKSLNKLLKTFFSYAVEEGYLIKNPCIGKKIIIPGANEIKCEEMEIFDENENFHKETVVLSPKSETSNRTVPIPSTLIKKIEEHEAQQNEEKIKAGDSYNNSELAFATATGNAVSSKNLFNSYSTLLKKANIPHKKFHTLRHTYATLLFEAEVPVKTVQMLLDYSDIAITLNIYTHAMPKEKVKAAEKLNDLF